MPRPKLNRQIQETLIRLRPVASPGSPSAARSPAPTVTPEQLDLSRLVNTFAGKAAQKENRARLQDDKDFLDAVQAVDSDGTILPKLLSNDEKVVSEGIREYSAKVGYEHAITPEMRSNIQRAAALRNFNANISPILKGAVSDLGKQLQDDNLAAVPDIKGTLLGALGENGFDFSGNSVSDHETAKRVNHFIEEIAPTLKENFDAKISENSRKAVRNDISNMLTEVVHLSIDSEELTATVNLIVGENIDRFNGVDVNANTLAAYSSAIQMLLNEGDIDGAQALRDAFSDATLGTTTVGDDQDGAALLADVDKKIDSAEARGDRREKDDRDAAGEWVITNVASDMIRSAQHGELETATDRALEALEKDTTLTPEQKEMAIIEIRRREAALQAKDFAADTAISEGEMLRYAYNLAAAVRAGDLTMSEAEHRAIEFGGLNPEQNLKTFNEIYASQDAALDSEQKGLQDVALTQARTLLGSDDLSGQSEANLNTYWQFHDDLRADLAALQSEYAGDPVGYNRAAEKLVSTHIEEFRSKLDASKNQARAAREELDGAINSVDPAKLNQLLDKHQDYLTPDERQRYIDRSTNAQSMLINATNAAVTQERNIREQIDNYAAEGGLQDEAATELLVELAEGIAEARADVKAQGLGPLAEEQAVSRFQAAFASRIYKRLEGFSDSETLQVLSVAKGGEPTNDIQKEAAVNLEWRGGTAPVPRHKFLPPVSAEYSRMLEGETVALGPGRWSEVWAGRTYTDSKGDTITLTNRDFWETRIFSQLATDSPLREATAQDMLKIGGLSWRDVESGTATLKLSPGIRTAIDEESRWSFFGDEKKFRTGHLWKNRTKSFEVNLSEFQKTSPKELALRMPLFKDFTELEAAERDGAAQKDFAKWLGIEPDSAEFPAILQIQRKLMLTTHVFDQQGSRD